ncbi:MAG: GIY-YIG nuclease family protein, partial [bacterium]
MDLLVQAKKLPLSSGVYFFLDKQETVLYVGRALSLKKRVLNYFQKNLDSRISEMVLRAKTIKYKKTDNLLEAIILEANLIKKYWPKYNVKEKDNRSFLYIVIPKTDYPRPMIMRERELDKFLPRLNGKKESNIFGPYQSIALIKNSLRIIRRIFPYSTCRVNSGKPCFDFQVGLCPGACVGQISKEDYQQNIANLILFLKGEKKKLVKKLKKENPFQVEGLRHIQDVALISREDAFPPFSGGIERIEGYDISHLAGQETFGSMVCFVAGQPDKKYYRLFKIKEAPANDDLRALEEMI